MKWKLHNFQLAKKAISHADSPLRKWRKNMTNYANQSKVENGIDYSKPSSDRPFKVFYPGAGFYYVSKEIYDVVKHDEWNEDKRVENERRCKVPDKNGGLCVCHKNCSECPLALSGNTNGGIVSLDEVYDLYELELARSEDDIKEDYTRTEKKEAIAKAIGELAIDDQEIIKLFIDGFSDVEIAEKIGFHRNSIAKKKKVLFSELAQKLKNLHE
jgi:hypothetical protein